MRNLLNFLTRYNNLIFFLILEGLALYLLTTCNNYHSTRVINGLRGLTLGIEEKMNNARSYFSLRKLNKSLLAENAALRNNIKQLAKKEDHFFFSITNSTYNQQYQYTSAEVINNSVNRQKNFFSLNKGKRHGIDKDMAVTSAYGIAGMIVGCSENYSRAMSLLNLDFRVSARIKSNGYFGSLNWDGRDVSHAILNEIPQHVTVNEGDTIETTGYSTIFPEGIMIGTISEFEKSGSDFYIIKVDLVTDFKKLRYVNIIGNMKKSEQLELEELFQ